MTDYRWVVDQLKLCRDPAAKLNRVAEIIVEAEGNNSEKHGLKFGLIPRWAVDKARAITGELTGNERR